MPTPARESGRASVPAVLAAHAALLARAGQLGQAEQWLAALIEGNDGEAAADLRCLLGKVQAQQGRLDAAKASLRAALQRDAAHAGARAALASLEGGQPALRRRVLVAGGAGLCALAGAAAWLGGRQPGTAGPQATLAAATPPNAAAVTAPGHSVAAVAAVAVVASDPVATQLQDVDHYARWVVGLSRFAGVASLQSQAIGADAQGLRVRLTGTVPSAHVLRQVRAVVARHPQLRVDDASVSIDHRYRVRRGDSLASIAARLYGRAERWPVLRRANPRAGAVPRQLAPGTVIVVP